MPSETFSTFLLVISYSR